MVSVKDQLYLTDMLAWNLLASKKAHFFATQCQDPQVADLINRSGQMHQRHYDAILAHLNQIRSKSTISIGGKMHDKPKDSKS